MCNHPGLSQGLKERTDLRRLEPEPVVGIGAGHRQTGLDDVEPIHRVAGLAHTAPDGLVMTFSRRPDVFQRALDAASGGEGLSSNPVISAMRGWMVEKPDVEVFVDIGRISKLVNQMAKIIPGANQMTLPIPEDMPPIGFSMSVENSRVDTATVIPSEVIGAGIGTAMRQGLGAR